jgi:FAD:protein FMN transferase
MLPLFANGWMRQAAITSDMRLAKTAFLIMVVCLLPACKKSEISAQKISIEGNDTLLDIRDGSPTNIAAAIADTTKLLKRQREFSHAWKPSELSRINEALAAGQSPAISQDNLHLLEISKPLYAASDTYYDPGIGSLVRMWGFYTDKFPISKKPPSNEEISNWLVHKPDFLGIAVGKKNITAKNPNTQLDFSTILEGVAAEEIKRVLAQRQIQDAMVTMGSDQFIVGNDNTRPWTVKLKDPFGGDLGQINLQGNEALFSSGNFNKFRVAPTGSRWGHVLNPHTGKPSQGSAAVVVLHGDPVLADAASTALMAGGPGNFGRLVLRMKLACAMMVTEENELLITLQMKKRITFFRDPVPLGQPIANGESCRQQ